MLTWPSRPSSIRCSSSTGPSSTTARPRADRCHVCMEPRGAHWERDGWILDGLAIDLKGLVLDIKEFQATPSSFFLGTPVDVKSPEILYPVAFCLLSRIENVQESYSSPAPRSSPRSSTPCPRSGAGEQKVASRRRRDWRWHVFGDGDRRLICFFHGTPTRGMRQPSSSPCPKQASFLQFPVRFALPGHPSLHALVLFFWANRRRPCFARPSRWPTSWISRPGSSARATCRSSAHG